MLTTKEKNRLKKMVEGNKTFHYSYVDRLRQDVRYYVNQCESAVIKRYQHGTQKQTLKMIKNQLKNWNAGQLSCSAAIRKGD